MKKIILLVVLQVVIGYQANCQELLWANRIGGIEIDKGYTTCVDNMGNVYGIGFFNNTVDFDPGPEVFNLTAANTVGGGSVYITKLDEAGNFIWAKQIGNGSGNTATFSLTLDPQGNLSTNFFFSGTVDVDPGDGILNLTSNPSNGISNAILKIDPSGSLIWARQFNGIGGTGLTNTTLKSDAAGNIFSTGSFKGTVDFDPGSGVFVLSNPNPNTNSGYILKLNSAGNFLWAKKLANTTISQTSSLSAIAGTYDIIDPQNLAFDNFGNVYTVGYFADTIDFDPGSGVFNLINTNSNGSSGYISKLSSDGNFLWAKQFKPPTNASPSCPFTYSSIYVLSVSIDAMGNVFTTGYFDNCIDLDPGPNTFTLTSAGSFDMFVCKLDPSGNFLWANRSGSTSNDYGDFVIVDNSGNYYFSGRFRGVVDFDAGLGVNNLTSVGGGNDIFIGKYDNSGNLIWVRRMGGSGNETVHSIAVNVSNEVFMSGWFQGTSDFDPGPGVFNLVATGISSSFGDAYMLKLNNCPTSYSSINVSACNSYTSPSGNFSWTSTGVYTDSLLTSLGCDSIITINLTIYNSPTPTITTLGSTTLCQGGSVSLNAGSGYASYTWNTGAQTQTINAVNGNIYTVTVSNGNGCSGSDSQEVIVNLNPTPSIIPLGATTFCEGGSVTLETDSAYVSYNWNSGGNSQAINANTSNTYSVTVTDANGCLGTASETVQVIPNPTPLITSEGSTTICEGESLNLDGGPDYVSYLWTGGFDTQYISVSNPGVFDVTVTDENGCIGTSAPIEILQIPFPSALFSYTENNNSISFTDLTTGNPNFWVWDFGDGSASSQQNPTHSYSASGDYLVCLIASEANCSDSLCQVVNITITDVEDTETLTASIYPNPNNGIFSIEAFDTFLSDIYDMHGKIIFSVTLYPGKNEIDLSHISSGIYFLRAANLETSFEKKLEIIR